MTQTNLLKEFNVQIKGRGTQPILFAHGLGCDQRMWRFVAPAFEDFAKVVLFDYIGSGQSDISFYDKEKYSSLHGYAADVVTICRELGLQNVIFVGHSVSCMIGLLAAIQEPSLFSRVVMVAPNPCYLNDGDYHGGFEKAEIDRLLALMAQNMEGWANMFSPQIMAIEEKPELTNELCESFCAADPAITHQFATATFYSDNRPDLKRLTVKSLILQCCDDILAPPKIGEYMHRQMPGSTLRHLKATGHCPHLTAPDETTSEIKDYIKIG